MENRPLTALIVDRSEPIRTLLTAFLSRSGFAVDAASDVDSAIAKLRASNFDLLVIDPACSSDGDGVGRVASAFPTMIGRTVVIASPPHSEEAQPVHAVLNKPFELDKLLEVMIDCSRARHSPHG
jgi:DNA-binding response OmpR family regulator